MASGSSGLPNSGSNGLDFPSDDILCSYEDYANQESSNGSHFDPSTGTNPSKEFQKSRISRSPVFPATNVYSQPEGSLSQEVISTVEITVKKYADNLMRFLEGISSRLSQLELYCYNLDKSIGEMRSDLIHDHGEADLKLKSLEKNLQEVHRAVQILRDKQELAETQKEIAKLQLVHKESSVPVHDEKTRLSAAESKTDDASDVPNNQLALALPSQVAPQSSHATLQQQAVAALPPFPSQNLTQVPPHYLPSPRLSNPQTQAQHSYIPADALYRAPQLTPQGPQSSKIQVNQTPQAQQFPQYQQQWSHQVSQPVQPSQVQLPHMQPQNQIRASAPPSSVYPPYMGGQPTNPPPSEAMVSSISMQLPFPGFSLQGVSRAEATPYGYVGASRPVQRQPSPPHMKGGFTSHPTDGYSTDGSYPSMTSGGTYMLQDNEGARPYQLPPPSHFSPGGYPPAIPLRSTPPPPSSNAFMTRNPSPQSFARNPPFTDLIDKLVSMGYRGDHVLSVIQRLEDSGQPVDFNAVLDKLNGHSSGGSQRGW